MRFSSLGSGSAGNALLVEAHSGTTTTRILLDCGFTVRELSKRLARLSLAIEDLDAVLVTHEHGDHIGSALSLARRAGIPVHMSWGTAQATKAVHAKVDLRVCEAGMPLAIGDLQALPYTVPHDAREPLQFVFADGKRRLGVLTDSGSSTAHIVATLDACDSLILECNHDREMLARSRYPASLRARVGGNFGHLSNATAAQILASIDHSRLRHVVAAHLSQENNKAELAQSALAQVLGSTAPEVLVADQEAGFAWLDL